MKIVIAGLGQYFQEIENYLQKEAEIAWYIDNDVKKQGKSVNGRAVYSPYCCPVEGIDYVIIAIMGFRNMRQLLILCGFDEHKIISYFDENTDFYQFSDLFQADKAIIHSMKGQISYLNLQINKIKEENELVLEHYVYEVADKFLREDICLPYICSIEETWAKIIEDRVSVSRYGDGEFQIILGNAKDVYQNNDTLLAKRLKEILVSNLDNHIVAIAADYGCLDAYKRETRNVIRRYMTAKKRRQHYQLLDMDKKYYNAYISRPYAYYPKEETREAQIRFEKLKQIWNDEEVVIIEGDRTRMGVGNDLFVNVKSLTRIIAPNENAFSVYEEILLNVIKKCNKKQLLLIALGPAATVLAYDLAKEGYWAIDIGHLDLEYEWFLKGDSFSYIPNKYNNELPGDTVVGEIFDEDYEKSIIGKICGKKDGKITY